MLPSDNLVPMCSPEEALEWAMSVEDGLGRGIDDFILRPVAAFYRMGVSTIGSCQGHNNRGLPFPWIQISPSSLERANILLEKYPLPGWSVAILRGTEEVFVRLMPVPTPEEGIRLIADNQKLLPGDGDPRLRRRLMVQLEYNQDSINQWADQMLALGS